MADDNLAAIGGTPFENLKQLNEHGAEFWRRRDIQPLFGYDQWRRFDGVIRRTQQLILSGLERGEIRRVSRRVQIGSGAMRAISDYVLDEGAFRVVQKLCATFKLQSVFCVRNETALFVLLRKYFATKNIPFVHQFRLAGSVFDAKVGSHILIEFDEPHHADLKQRRNDSKKTSISESNGMTILRFGLYHDIVDIILRVEANLGREEGSAVHSDDL